MQNKFVTNLALLIVLNLLIKPFWVFGIDRTVQNIVGAESYGLYFSLLNVSFLFNIFLDVGITNFNNRNISQNRQLLNKHFSSIVVMKFSLSIVYLLITAIFSLIVGYSREYNILLMILCGNQFLASFILYLRSNISGLHLFKTDSILSVLDRLLMISICATLLWGGIVKSDFKIEWFIYAQTLSYLITFIVALIIVIRKSAFKKIRWNIPFYLVIFKKSAPFALLILLMGFYYRIDGIMLERMLENGTYEAGVYAAAFRLLDAGVMMVYLFPVILLPTLSLMLKQKQSVEHIFKLSFSLIMVLAVTIGAGGFFYRYEIIDILYHNNVELTAPVFGILMFCFIAIAAGNIFSTLLTANGNLRQLNLLALTGMVLNIILNIILIPKFKSLGSAYASLITQFFICFLQIATIYTIFNFKINIKLIISLIIFITLSFTTIYISKLLPFYWLINLVAAILVSLLVAMASRLISFKEVLKGFQ